MLIIIIIIRLFILFQFSLSFSMIILHTMRQCDDNNADDDDDEEWIITIRHLTLLLQLVESILLLRVFSCRASRESKWAGSDINNNKNFVKKCTLALKVFDMLNSISNTLHNNDPRVVDLIEVINHFKLFFLFLFSLIRYLQEFSGKVPRRRVWIQRAYRSNIGKTWWKL